MNLNLYNELSHLICWVIIYLLCLKVVDIPYDTFDTLPATAIAYVIWYFINAFWAWVEWFLFWSWWGKPSSQLLDGKKCWRIYFYEYEKVKQLLNNKAKKPNPTNDNLFGIAMRLVDETSKVESMNWQYAFSRALFITTIIGWFLLVSNFYCYAFFWLTFLFLLLVVWHRAKERWFYYAKEVLQEALNELELKK